MASSSSIVFVLTCFLTTGLSIDEGWFWHVTDFHWDTTYGSAGLSCNAQTTRGEFGDFWCDSPWLLVNASVEAMKTIRSDVDFILWTGDSVAHISNNDTSLDQNDWILGNITELLHTSFPSTQLYATYGNHDYYPSNQFPPNGNELYNRTFQQWRQWINGTEEEATFRKGAYYTLKTSHGIRIVALNTNLYYKSDKVTPGLTDPADQFSWMINVMSAARRNNEKVIVTGHVPPVISPENGKPWMHTDFHNKFNDIILNFTNIIVGMHFGHQHIDDLRMYYKAGVPSVVLFSAPAVTPWRYKIQQETGPARNPGIRLVKYDRQSGIHLDLIQYYLDLQLSNLNHHAMWKKEYQMTRDYHLMDITPTSINELFLKLKDRNSATFRSFFKWQTVNMDRACDRACHLEVLCGFAHFKETEFDNCRRQGTIPDIVG